MGHRRFARHWAGPPIRGALPAPSQMPRAADASEEAIPRAHSLLAARQQAPQGGAAADRHVEALVLSSEGLQPEQGHATLDVVRELPAQRRWCAEALLSSNAAEVRRRLRQARA
jgi:hypothetical protein